MIINDDQDIQDQDYQYDQDNQVRLAHLWVDFQVISFAIEFYIYETSSSLGPTQKFHY